MQKLRFLCCNHQQWLAGNPEAVASTWQSSFSRGLDLAEENNFVAAVRHAGAAFETAEIGLSQQHRAGKEAIGRLADAAVLLVRLLHRLDEPAAAGSILSATIDRLERLLATGAARREAVLAGCDSMLQLGDELGLWPCRPIRARTSMH